MTPFELQLQQDLHQYLLSLGRLEERLPDAPDLEAAWPRLADAYLPDGIREFQDYPQVSLGWMMYIGMAIAKQWDADWALATSQPCLYAPLRDARGYDAMDEHIRQDILGLSGEDFTAAERLVGECAQRTLSKLRHAGCEPGTPAAFHAYVAALHQLYLMGAAVQLLDMGYHMRQL